MAESRNVKIENSYANAAYSIISAIRMHDIGMSRALSLCFPAAVLEYDRKTHIAVVQPLVKQGYYNKEWEYENRDPISVTVKAIQQGGFVIDIPLFRGDTGWVVASDRDTALLKQEGALTSAVLDTDMDEDAVASTYPQKPNTMALHDLSNGFFIPDNWGLFDIGRYKDGGGVNLSTSLYLGQSISTTDDEQDGEDYENNTSSSIVIERKGGIHMMSSSPKEDDRSVRLSVMKDRVESEFIDDAENIIGIHSLHPSEGILTRMDSADHHFHFQNCGGATTFRTVQDGKKVLAISMTDSGIAIQATGNISVSAKESVSICAEGNAFVAAESADIHADENLDFRSRDNIEILHRDNIKIKCEGSLDIEGGISVSAAEDIVLKCGKMTMETLGGIAFSSLGSEEETGLISIKSGEKIEMLAETKEVETREEKTTKKEAYIRWTGVDGQHISIDEERIYIEGAAPQYYDLENNQLVEKRDGGTAKISANSIKVNGAQNVYINVSSTDGEVKMAGFNKSKVQIRRDVNGGPYYQKIWAP